MSSSSSSDSEMETVNTKVNPNVDFKSEASPATATGTATAAASSDVSGDGGITKKILKEGNGDAHPTKGADVTVHYTGRLLDGTVFDSSRKRNEPFNFKIGKGQVIKGWDQGVATMKKGEVAILTCKPDYAYGARGSPPTIPANATLEFEVELISWTNEQKVTDDNKVTKVVIRDGDGYLKPNDGSKIVANIAGYRPDGTIFMKHTGDVSKPLVIGESSELLVEGLEAGLKDMLRSEKIELFVNEEYAFGSQGDEKLQIPAHARVKFDVELVSFENAKESYEMDTKEKIEAAKKHKDKGNDFFKQGQWKRALKKYELGAKMFSHDGSLSEDEKKDTKAIKIVCWLNMAACHLKLNKFKDVLTNTKDVLDVEPANVKALYRRSRALMSLGQEDEALNTLKKAAEFEPNNQDVKKAIALANQKMRAHREKEKRLFSKMFDKVKLTDDREETNKNTKTVLPSSTEKHEPAIVDAEARSATDPRSS